MVAIAQATVQGYINAGINAATTALQGRALEDLVCYLFGLVPGIDITHRNVKNVFATEEIRVALFNDGLPFLPHIILVEAKNWSKPVGSSEVAWFINKLSSRGLDFGILVSVHGITGDADDLTAAHHTIAMGLAKRCRLILVTTNEILALNDTLDLTTLIKRKLCDLAVRGTVG